LAQTNPGILYDLTGRELVAPLIVVASPDSDAFVKLVYAGTENDAIGIYVRAGTQTELSMPLGAFEMRYASGETWRGLRELFGPDTYYGKAAETFYFGETPIAPDAF
jgi:hypothetical protein